MSGNSFFVDTNILLYLLSGNETIAELLNEKQLYISFVTQLELLGYKGISKQDLVLIEQMIDKCIVIDINQSIKQIVINLRRKYKLKLPDAIIIASSIYYEQTIISADSDFKKVKELDLLYFESE
jgi:predicted nucleic acid-binding protein